MKRSIWGTVVVTVLVVAALGFGGYAVFQAGYQQGLVENASEVVVRDGPTWGPGFFPFFPFFGILFFLLFFGVIGRFAFGRSWRGWGGPYDSGEGSPMDRRLTEWHERAHQPRRTYQTDDDTT